MYLFMKAIGFTHLNLEGITECRIVYNHWKETTKIGNWWRNFAQSQNLQAGTQIIFEFLDATTNFFMDLFVARVHYTIVLSICKFLFISVGGIYFVEIGTFWTHLWEIFVYKSWWYILFINLAYFRSFIQLWMISYYMNNYKLVIKKTDMILKKIQKQHWFFLKKPMLLVKNNIDFF